MINPRNIEIKDSTATVTVNPKMYSLEAVYAAAYVLIDRAYIVLDGDKENEIKVLITMKNDSAETLLDTASSFNNELLMQSDYLSRAKETKAMREMYLQRAILTSDPSLAQEQQEEADEDFKEIEEIDDDIFDDPEGIAIPWEEKYGEGNDNEDSTEQ